MYFQSHFVVRIISQFREKTTAAGRLCDVWVSWAKIYPYTTARYRASHIAWRFEKGPTPVEVLLPEPNAAAAFVGNCLFIGFVSCSKQRSRDDNFVVCWRFPRWKRTCILIIVFWYWLYASPVYIYKMAWAQSDTSNAHHAFSRVRAVCRWHHEKYEAEVDNRLEGCLRPLSPQIFIGGRCTIFRKVSRTRRILQ